MRNQSEWKEFERLVARIEEIAAPQGAVIKSPDRIRDLTTGKMREVDASIRYRVGTADILITIECRKRSRRADDTWIEQLATKRNKLGAAKTIAVSSTGFSDSALITARHHGLELRVLSEISAQDLHGWFLPTGAVHVFRKIEQIECVVFLQCTDGLPTDYGFKAPDEFEPIFYHDRIHSPFPAATLFHLVELIEPDCFFSIPLDGSLTKMAFKLGPCGLSVKGQEGRLAVHNVRLSALVGYETAVCELESGTHHRYALPDGEIQRTTFDAQLFGLPFEFEHQAGQTGDSHVSFRVKKPNSEAPNT